MEDKDIRIAALEAELSELMNHKVELRMQVVALQQLLKALGIESWDDIPTQEEENTEEEE